MTTKQLDVNHKEVHNVSLTLSLPDHASYIKAGTVALHRVDTATFVSCVNRLPTALTTARFEILTPHPADLLTRVIEGKEHMQSEQDRLNESITVLSHTYSGSTACLKKRAKSFVSVSNFSFSVPGLAMGRVFFALGCVLLLGGSGLG